MSLPLDKRWSLAERRAYDVALRAGDFGACLRIVCPQLSPEQYAAAHDRAMKYLAILKPESH